MQQNRLTEMCQSSVYRQTSIRSRH